MVGELQGHLDETADLSEPGVTHCGCSSAVERQLPKLNVVGSIPITRSILFLADGVAMLDH